MTDSKEPFSYLDNPPIDSVLGGSDFSIQQEVTLPQNKVRGLLKQKYPKFNFDGLDSDSTLEVAGRALLLDQLSQKVVDLVRSGQPTEGHILARKIKLVGDPEISEVQTSIKNVLETTHGNLDMASSFLHLDKKTGRSWINFIVRTWGNKPSDFK